MLVGSLLILSGLTLLAAHRIGRDLLSLPSNYWSDVPRFSRIYWSILATQGFVGLFTSIGLFAKRRWAYNLYTVVNGLVIGYSAYQLVSRHELTVIPLLVWNCCTMIYMLLPGVRKAFA